MKLFLIALAVSAAVVNLSCSKKTEVSGEVYIIGKESNHKIGSAEITAVPEDGMRQFLESKRQEFEAAKTGADEAQELCLASNKYDCFDKWLEARDKLKSLYFDVYPATWESKTGTDSDGKYELSLSQNGRYALMVKARRDGKEYYWIHWVKAEGNPVTASFSDEADSRFQPQSPDEILAKR